MLNTHTNFNGYKNIISDSINSSESGITFMVMELDNEGGFRDLEQYNKLRHHLSMGEKEEKYLMLTATKSSVDFDHLFLEKQEIPSCEQLNFLKKDVSNEIFKSYEKTILKLYTFLADITKRIMNDNNIKQDNMLRLAHSLARYIENLGYFSNNSNAVTSFICNTMQSVIPKQEIALYFNKVIKTQMMKYFL